MIILLPPSNMNRISHDLEKYIEKHFNFDQDLNNITEDTKKNYWTRIKYENSDAK